MTQLINTNENNNKMMIFEDKTIEIFVYNNEIMFNPRDVASCLNLEFKTVQNYMSEMNENQVIKITNDSASHLKRNQRINNAGENFLTKQGIISLLSRSRKCSMATKRKLLTTLFPDKDIFLSNNYKETEFFMLLEQTLQPFELTIQKQFKCLSYKIDGYIVEKNIAIEYDENGHNHYSFEAEQTRQTKIENELNCKFIRINDSDTHSWNVGYVIKNIFSL